jgi:hypothetical protein
MDDAIFNFYTIPKVRAKSSSCLYWWRVQSRQIADKQTSLIDHTFDCSSDYWQWSNCARAQLHINSTTEFRWDCSYRVVYEKWMMLSLPSTQFLRLEQNHHLNFIDEESSRVQTDCWQTNFIDSSHIWLFFRLLTMIQWCSCQVAHYLDDWIQIGLLFPCSSHKMDDAIFTLYTIPKVRAKSSSCLYWWRVDRVQKDCWQTSWIDVTFDRSSDFWQWSICAHAQLVAHYLDDWIQMGLLFPCSSWKLDDAIFNFYTISKVRAKSSSCLYWWRVQSRQIVDKQTSLIDHTFDCSSDYWQWSNCARAQLHITSTTEFRWDYPFRVGYEKWLMLSLPYPQFSRWEQNHHLVFIDNESSPDKLLTNKLHWLITHFIVLRITDNDLILRMPGCTWSWRLNSDWTALSV